MRNNRKTCETRQVYNLLQDLWNIFLGFFPLKGNLSTCSEGALQGNFKGRFQGWWWGWGGGGEVEWIRISEFEKSVLRPGSTGKNMSKY